MFKFQSLLKNYGKYILFTINSIAHIVNNKKMSAWGNFSGGEGGGYFVRGFFLRGIFLGGKMFGEDFFRFFLGNFPLAFVASSERLSLRARIRLFRCLSGPTSVRVSVLSSFGLSVHLSIIF